MTIAVRDDEDWRAFCAALGQPELAALARFATTPQRLQNQDELDGIVAGWTSARTSYDVMEQLQSAGVPAGPVLTAAQALKDPHFRHRGFFENVTHPDDTGWAAGTTSVAAGNFPKARRNRRASAPARRGQRLCAAGAAGAAAEPYGRAGRGGGHRHGTHRRSGAVPGAAGDAGGAGLDRRVRLRLLRCDKQIPSPLRGRVRVGVKPRHKRRSYAQIPAVD